MTVNYGLLGKRISEVRKQQGLSQEELARLADVSSQYISMVETGKKKASLQTVVSIADSLGITVDELLVGNQMNDPVEYLTDIDMLLFDCTRYEKRVLYETMVTLKESLRTNSELKDEER